MDRKRKAALMTIHQVPNYGSVLQTFATQTLLRGLGYECDVINYRYPNRWHLRRFYSPGVRLRLLLSNLATRIGLKKKRVREANLDKFKAARMRLTREYPGLKSLEKVDWSGYDCVIAGSDQIWNPRFLHGDKTFMLSFVPDGVRKISLASSFAVGELPDELKPVYKEYLGRMSALSVREQTGAELLRELLPTVASPAVILDPALLLTAAQWDEMLGQSVSPDDRYVLVYLLDYALDPYPYIYNVIREMQRRYGCTVKVTGEFTPPGQAMEGVEYLGYVPVEEFVGLFRCAECVVTTSFHGTAFAVTYGRPLVSVVPGGRDDRQLSLLRQLGIEHCAVRIGDPVEKIRPECDVEPALGKLSAARKANIEWIKAALSS